MGVRNITVAPVGLDVAVLKSDYRTFDKVQLRSDLGFEDDDIVLCNVSRLEADKRPLDLIEIFQHIKDKKKFKLLLIGEGRYAGSRIKKLKSTELLTGLRESTVFLIRICGRYTFCRIISSI